MKKGSKIAIIVIVALIIIGLIVAGLMYFLKGGENTTSSPTATGSNQNEINIKDIPEQVTKYKKNSQKAVLKVAEKLEGSWGDSHKKFTDSKPDKNVEKSSSYKELQASLRTALKKTKGKRAYTLIKGESGNYTLAIDTRSKPEAYGTDYGKATPFTEAFDAGLIAASRSAFETANGNYFWTSYSPVYDSNGDVVAIVAVDYPAPDIKDYPEWNRDSKDWNELDK